MHHSLFQIKSKENNKIYNVLKIIKNQYIVMEVSLSNINDISMNYFKKFIDLIDYLGIENISKLDNDNGLVFIQEIINNNYFKVINKGDYSYITLPFINELEVVMYKLLSTNKNIKDPSSYTINRFQVNKNPKQTAIQGVLSCELYSFNEKVSEIVVHIEMRDLRKENRELFNDIKRLILFTERKLNYRLTEMSLEIMLGSFLTTISKNNNRLEFRDIIDTIFLEVKGATSTQFNSILPISK
ncbi:hypothetical protein PBI_PBS1_126 [Bacillus phage PBS1]|uniref:Uncharacterized protein n=1 Tax=Bacillus phage PBS1 TaxID=2884423 RepID=A0A223LEK9_BPPB1|nr:hypothetical protein FK780_gp126 [Bacillus phage PBS1]AST99948.1 hypothetical protein PBI_PBS1_126 [Bacillus phage PBS1]QXN70157.1 hypothetical protein INTERNEXUS_116 [Bacillus phage vB_BspM_Internexus]WCS68363.1 hypothetical protein Goe21_02530 [Bacillus phage vB_BsuM-Goe21]BDE75536.1 hypothetical protein [Bacillus phage PBS1]